MLIFDSDDDDDDDSDDVDSDGNDDSDIKIMIEKLMMMMMMMVMMMMNYDDDEDDDDDDDGHDGDDNDNHDYHHLYRINSHILSLICTQQRLYHHPASSLVSHQQSYYINHVHSTAPIYLAIAGSDVYFLSLFLHAPLQIVPSKLR